MSHNLLKTSLALFAAMTVSVCANAQAEERKKVVTDDEDWPNYALFSDKQYKKFLPIADEIKMAAFWLSRNSSGECVPTNFHGYTEEELDAHIIKYGLGTQPVYREGLIENIRSVTGAEAQKNNVTDYKSAVKYIRTLPECQTKKEPLFF
jgi:hypothetical protein